MQQSFILRDSKEKNDGQTQYHIKLVKELVTFYPAHIAKEDRRFFYPCLQYLSQKEQNDMLQEFWESDRKLIHDKYPLIVQEAERRGCSLQ